MQSQGGFSLVEILITIAVIAIITAVIMPRIWDIKEGASLTIARQQQAQLQTALDSWISAQSSVAGGLAATRQAYSGDKLELLRDYLQERTYSALSTSDGNKVTSAALNSVGARLEFSAWSDSDAHPSILWVNE